MMLRARLFRARQHGPRADLHPHQARRRPRREAARRQRHPGQRHPRQQEPAAARARAGRVQGRRASKILVATDIAARGIDVSGVSHVINFELPNVSEQYVHRIGRTARAGAAGVAIAFCAPDEQAYLKGIEKLTRQQIEVDAAAGQFHRRGEPDQGDPRPRRRRRPARSGARRSSARAPVPPAARAARPGPLCRPGQADGRQPPRAPRPLTCLRGARPDRGTPLRRGLVSRRIHFCRFGSNGKE